MIKHLSVASVAREVEEHDTKIWRILDYYVEDAIESREFSDVEAIGVDEYSHKGHNYITLFLSHPNEKRPQARVLDIQDGKGKDTVIAFKKTFSSHNGVRAHEFCNEKVNE